MHCETESLVKFLFGEMDTLKVRMDLKEANVRPHLWPILGKKPGCLTLPQASYVLTKEKEGSICECCAATKTSYSLCWPIVKMNPRGRESKRIEIPWLSCPYVTSVATLCTHNHEKGRPNMYNKIEPDIQTLMRQNHQPIEHKRTTRRYSHHLVHTRKKSFHRFFFKSWRTFRCIWLKN